MTVERSQPKLWSDFDGTAVELAKLNLFARALKYPLPLVPGYVDFIRGVEGAGVEIAGVASRRPDIAIRRWATERSIAKQGLGGHLASGRIVLAGSEHAKAEFIVEQSRASVIGMVDDRPHKIGSELLGILAKDLRLIDSRQTERSTVVLGVVSHERSEDYTYRLLEEADNVIGEGETEEFDYYPSENVINTGYRMRIGHSTLEVVNLMPYSQDVGEKFAEHLKSRY